MSENIICEEEHIAIRIRKLSEAVVKGFEKTVSHRQIPDRFELFLEEMNFLYSRHKNLNYRKNTSEQTITQCVPHNF